MKKILRNLQKNLMKWKKEYKKDIRNEELEQIHNGSVLFIKKEVKNE